MFVSEPSPLPDAPESTVDAPVTLEMALTRLSRGGGFSQRDMQGLVDLLLFNDHTEAQVAAFLFGLHMKGETVDELVGAALALRQRAVPVPVAVRPMLDTAGTGGDGANSINLSTVAALIAAGAGVTVAKHGNRAASSQCGSADVLAHLGVSILMTPEDTAWAIDHIGIGFLFAPSYHPAMARIAGVRRALGVRTLFNLLGPLANPAHVRAQLIGVYHPDHIEVVAQAVVRLGVERALVVSAEAGLDEIAPEGRTMIAQLSHGVIHRHTVTPADFGLAAAPMASIRGGTVADNAQALEAILRGENHPGRTAALLNAAAALVAAGVVADFRAGATLAAQTIASGAALAKLQALRARPGAPNTQTAPSTP